MAKGIVLVLVRLLDSPSEMKEKTIATISRVSTVETTKNVLLAEGLLVLNHLLRVLGSGSAFAIEKACIALQVEMVRHLAEGFVQRVVEVLSCEVLAVRVLAARMVHVLGINSNKARKEMGELGCVSGLIKMLDGKDAPGKSEGVLEGRKRGCERNSSSLFCFQKKVM